MLNKNYSSEVIPDISELVYNAENTLKSLESNSPIKIKGSIVNSKGEYIGKIYFSNQSKNSYSYKSINENDFSGLYIFYNKTLPVYVGISGTIIRRLKYHLFGLKENESSLVYLIANEKYQFKYGIEHNGQRKDFPFDEFRLQIQSEIISKWSFKYFPIENGYQLSFSEIYVACALKTRWNTFKTH